MADATLMPPRGRRVLFLQCTNAGGYPPIIHAAQMFAERGWSVDILSSPELSTSSLLSPSHPLVTHYATPTRRQNAVRPLDYMGFVTKTIYLSMVRHPNIVYASDPMGSGPGLIAAKLLGAALVYHEHDTPANGALPSWLFQLRKMAARRALSIVIPNGERGRLLCEQTNQSTSKLRIVWNLPRKTEVPSTSNRDSSKLTLYFHGSITPDRLPALVVDAVRRFDGRIRLLIAGYEAPGAIGYLEQLLARGRASSDPMVEYLGQIPREDLLRTASNADVGLAFMPNQSADVNMRHMVGASNKPFDYMAAGLALLVSDLPDWVTTYCARGFGRCCNPSSEESVAGAFSWFLDHPLERQSMGEKGRRMIRDEWNYDLAFAGVLDELDRI